MSKDTGGPAFPVIGMSQRHGQPIESVFDAGMTLRQYAAIKLRLPDSGSDWLDEMIVKSLRDEFAAKAMQGLLAMQASPHLGAVGVNDGASHQAYWDHGNTYVMAADCYVLADAMLAERSKP